MSFEGEPERCTFTWRLANFSSCTAEDYHKVFWLPSRRAEFTIRLRPFGFDYAFRFSDVVHYTFIGAWISGPLKEAEAHFKLTLLDATSTPWKSIDGQMCQCETGAIACSYLVVSRPYILNPLNGVLLNGTLKITLEVVYYGKKAPTTSPIAPGILPKCETFPASELDRLSSNLTSLLHSGRQSDFTFIISGREFPVHKAILAARSTVFAAMFAKHSYLTRETLRDISGVAFEKCLQYIYSGTVTEMEKYAGELAVLADTYRLPSLKKSCEKYLIGQLSIETAVSTLLEADKNGSEEMKCKCIHFIARNIAQVRTTSGWKEMLKAGRMHLMDQLMKEVIGTT